MICQNCGEGLHAGCAAKQGRGDTWCDCQHVRTGSTKNQPMEMAKEFRLDEGEMEIPEPENPATLQPGSVPQPG